MDHLARLLPELLIPVVVTVAAGWAWLLRRRQGGE